MRHYLRVVLKDGSEKLEMFRTIHEAQAAQDAVLEGVVEAHDMVRSPSGKIVFDRALFAGTCLGSEASANGDAHTEPVEEESALSDEPPELTVRTDLVRWSSLTLR